MQCYQFSSLYNDTCHKGKNSEKFNFTYNRVRFQVIFLIDRVPFEILVGAIGLNWACTLTMERGFNVTGMQDADYYALRKILNFKKSGAPPFSSWAFIRIVASCVPKRCSSYVVQPHELARYKSNASDEDKIYFLGWNDHSIDHRKAQNFEKTERFLGKQVADFCRQHNISSLWTDIPQDANRYYPPEIHPKG